MDLRRFVTIILALAVVSACNNEPDFDERFEAAQQQVEETAERIDQELANGFEDAENSEETEGPGTGGLFGRIER